MYELLAPPAVLGLVNAHDGNDRIIYDEKSGKLIYHEIGDTKGWKIQFAVLDEGLDLSTTDFLVI